jgi:hypothetical protein
MSEFNRQAKGILSSENISQLEEFLGRNPEAGNVIPASGGIRKLRWKRPGMGTRGGSRVIYFYFVTRETVYLMGVYAKSDKEDLSDDDKKRLQKKLGELKGE